MSEPPLTELEEFRRLIMVIQGAAFNFGYFRGAKSTKYQHEETRFFDIQQRIDNNFLDIGVFEWCKLFADRENQHWRKHLDPNLHDNFATGLYALANKDEAGWKAYVAEFLLYRDKFLAHLDARRVMDIPHLDLALKALHYYANFLRIQHPQANRIDAMQFDIAALVLDATKTAKDYLR